VPDISFVFLYNAINFSNMNSMQETLVKYSKEKESAKGGGGVREKFYPSGAIAFFVALVLLCLVIWFGIYFLMLERI
jgi:hypothetical protein